VSSCGATAGKGLTIENPYDFSKPAKILTEPHAHTTLSDGKEATPVVLKKYADAGYQCLAITDHNLVNWPWPSDPGGMIPVQGDEVSKFPTLQNYHITSLFCDYVPQANVDPQTCLNEINRRGGLTVIAHPKLSGKKSSDIERLKGFDGIEIYNRSAELITNKGYSVDVWDSLLSTSTRPVWGYAVDDYHGNPKGIDCGKLMVLAGASTEDGVKAALKAGNFYCIVGQDHLRFKRISVSGQVITVVTSDPSHITFYGRNGNPLHAVANATGGTYKINGNEKYIRIEAVSTDGATTLFSNPIWIGSSKG
jgi:hypothetical protein